MNRHPDPAENPPPSRDDWPAYWRNFCDSPAMHQFDVTLRLDGCATLRASVLSELSAYFGCSEADALDRCTDGGRYFDEEWDAALNPAEFHRSTRSSSFSLLWAAYLQAEGYYWPTHAGVAQEIARLAPPPGAHLDFASAVGVKSQIFAQLGYSTTLTDISTTMLDFAKHRFARRGLSTSFIDLNEGGLPHEAYDVITATDVLSLVPDFAGTVRTLHAALRERGLLCANINGRPDSDARWQLQDNDLPLRRELREIGFEPVRSPAGNMYRKVSRRRWHEWARDAVLFGPLRSNYRRLRDQKTRWPWRHGSYCLPRLRALLDGALPWDLER